MKIAIFFLVLFHSVLMIGQDPEPSKYNIHNANLCVGDALMFGDKSIRFKKVVSDSRCPKGNAITCIWAGEVKVLVEFYENGEFKGEKIIAGSNISVGKFFDVKDLEISGVNVLPYPELGRKITPEEYSLNLKISEKVETD